MASKREREKRKINYTSPKERAQKHSSGDSTSVRIPEGMSFFSVKAAKTIKIDIIPYEVKKGNDEKGGNPHAETGQYHYERTYWAHRGIGIEQTSICCPRKTFGEKCPICEDQAKMRRDPDADDELVKSLEPKERQLFIVIDRDDKSDAEGVMKLWDISYHLFGKALDAKMKRAEADDDYVAFHSLEAGKTLRVGFEEKHMGKNAFFACDDIEMKSRKPLPESILDEVPDLDELLVHMEYDDLKRYYLQEEDAPADDDDDLDDTGDGDDDDDPPAKKPAAKKGKTPAKPAAKPAAKKKPVEEDQDEDQDDDDSDDDSDEEEFKVGDEVQHEEFGRCKILKLIEGGKKLDLKGEDGKTKKAVWASDVVPAIDQDDDDSDDGDDSDDSDDDDQDDDDDPPPAKKPGKTPAKPAGKKKPAEDDAEEDGWDDDDDEDDPPAKPAKKPAAKKK